MALYRTGDYEGALRTLKESARRAGRNEPWDLAFIAMAHQRLGHEQPARAAFAELTQLMAIPTWQEYNEATGFFMEAKALFVPDRRAVYIAVPPREDRGSEIREYQIAD